MTTTTTTSTTSVVQYPTPSTRPQPSYLTRPTPQELLDIRINPHNRREDFSPARQRYQPENDLEFVRPPIAESDITTLQQLADACYERYWRGSKGEDTAVYHVAEFVKFLGGLTLIRGITTTDIDRYTTWCSKQQNNAPATINRKLNTLGRMFSFALDRELITKKPKLERFKTPCGRLRWITPAEESAMLAFFDAQIATKNSSIKNEINSNGWKQFKSLFLFLLYTGCREGEALKLRWKDVADDRIYLWDTKGGATKDHCRTVPLLRGTIGEFIEVGNKAVENPNGLVFEGISKSNIKYRWNLAKKHLGLSDDKEFVPHCLRHTCATRLVQSGVSILVVKEWLGHSDIKMTMRYAHVSPSQLFDAASKLVVDGNQNPF